MKSNLVRINNPQRTTLRGILNKELEQFKEDNSIMAVCYKEELNKLIKKFGNVNER